MSADTDDHESEPATETLAAWMGQNHDELGLLLELGAIDWPDFASAFAQAGYRDTVGMPVTSQAAEFIWNALGDTPWPAQ